MSSCTRRTFVQNSLTGAAALSLGMSLPGAGHAESANEKVVLALIGAGGRGRGLIGQMAAVKNVAVKYICDAEQSRAAACAKEVEAVQGAAPQVVQDMRKVLDDQQVNAVVVATPEQWHALATIWACQAGKDVYVEKCISRKVEEGRKMIEAARKYRRIVQAGTQTRATPYAASARKYIQDGNLGQVLLTKVFFMQPNYVYGGYPMKRPPDSAPPPGLDWDAWLGPAPERPYNTHLHRNWYGYWDYSGGNGSDAIHLLDLARMVLGDPPHPKSVQCTGGRWQYNDGGEMPDCQVVAFEYDKMALTAEITGFSPYMKKETAETRSGAKFPYWPQTGTRVEIYGTKRLMCIGRHGGGWQVFVEDGKVADEEHGREGDQYAIPHFIECIRTRGPCQADIEPGHYSACLEHLANIAYVTGNQKLLFDGQAEKFVGNEEASKHLKAAARKQYRIPDPV